MNTAKGYRATYYKNSKNPRLGNDPGEPVFIELKVPFSASPYYDFLDAFLLGVKLDTYFDKSTDCINDVVHFVDDISYFQNNLTLSTKEMWDNPLMNLTHMLAGNFSKSWVDCYSFSYNVYLYFLKKYNSFNNNVGDFMLAFLFNLMGNALRFRQIFNEIQDDMNNQYYADIAQQYGRMIRIIFDFDPLTTASFTSEDISKSFAMFDDEFISTKEEKKPKTEDKSWKTKVKYEKSGASKTLEVVQRKWAEYVEPLFDLEGISAHKV